MEVAATLRAALTENLYLKFLSFALSVLLYSSFHGTTDAQRSVSVNMVLVMPQDSGNRVLVSSVPETVRLTLRGPRTALDELRADDVGNIQVVLRSSAERRVTLDQAMVHVPPNVRVEQIDPPSIDLTWEDVVVRDLPVQVSVVGTPAAGFVVKNVPVADPTRVRVRGPKSEVMVLQFVRADSFDVTGLTEGSYTRQLALDRPRGRVLMDTSAQSVQVATEVAREVVERPFIKVPVAVLGNAKGKSQPAEVDVRLSCPTDIVRALRPEQIVPQVTLRSTAPSGSESVPVEVTVDKCEAHITPENGGRPLVTRGLAALVAVSAMFASSAISGCTTEARNEASVPCDHDRECNSALTCLPAKNGVTGACLAPACSKTCATDDDCKGLRSSQQGDECFVCQEVGACPRAVRVDDAGSLKACVDRCVAQ